MLRFLFCCFYIFFSWNAFAQSGLINDNAPANFATGLPNETYTDLKVKVLGGYVRVTRNIEGKKWIWNRRWLGLSPTSIDSKTGHPRLFHRLEQPYYKIETNDYIEYENQLRYRINYLPELDQYQWSDKKGNKVNYAVLRDDNGELYQTEMLSYSDRNGIKVSVERNLQGNIEFVKDHLNNVVVTYYWDSVNGEERLSKVKAYDGREVNYSYDQNNQLVAVVDPNGQTYTYNYLPDGTYSGYTEPNGVSVQYEFSPESTEPTDPYYEKGGQLISKKRTGGQQEIYSASFNKETKEFSRITTDSTGVKTERRFNQFGQLVSYLIDGELKYQYETVLSDGSFGVDNLLDRYYSTCTRTTVVSLSGGRIRENTVCVMPEDKRSQIGTGQLVYVKKRIKKDALGRTTTSEYDQYQNEVKTLFSDGSSITRTFNTEYGLPLSITNERGIITEYEYDDVGNLLTLIEAKGTSEQRTTRYSYDQYGQLLSLTTGESAAGNTAIATTTYTYDAYGNRLTETNALDHLTQFKEYDSLGQPKRIIDAKNNAWIFSYDNLGHLLRAQNPLGEAMGYVYDKVGNLVEVTEANGAVTTLTYNNDNFPLTITNAAGKVSQFEYDAASRLVAMVDASHHGIYATYDGQGRLAIVTDGLSNKTRFTYKDQQLDSINYPTYQEDFTYDNKARLKTSQQTASGISVTRTQQYDVSDNPTTSIDANNYQTKQSYDALNRLISVEDALGGITRFTYDARDNLIEVSDAEQRITRYSYDLLDQQLSESKVDDATLKREYQYDARGNLSAVISPAGQLTQYGYDKANRLVKESLFANKADSLPIKVVTHSYNAFGQYTGYQQQKGSAVSGITPDIIELKETYQYNQLNQLTQVTLDYGVFVKSYQYTYHDNGQLKSYTNPEGITYSYYYNNNSQIQAVVLPGLGQISFNNYQWQRPQGLTLPGGNNINYSYDGLQREQSRSLLDAANNSLANANYSFDLENQITLISTEHGDYKFNYDSLYRLSQAQYPETQSEYLSQQSFDYDAVGNRLVEQNTFTNGNNNTLQTLNRDYNAINQLSREALNGEEDWAFTYTANGHTKTKTYVGSQAPSGPSKVEYVYNQQERLIAIKHDELTVGQYAYNPYGMRISKTVNGITTYFLYTGQGLSAEYDASGKLLKEYHYTPQRTWSTAPLFIRDASGNVYYYQNDHLGTPQRLIASSGVVVWQATYSAFGKASISINTIENNLRFPGQYYDAESGLHQNYFRDYDPELGRYLQSDPIGLKGGVNPFGYVRGNPVYFSDWSGLIPDCVYGIPKITVTNDVEEYYKVLQSIDLPHPEGARTTLGANLPELGSFRGGKPVGRDVVVDFYRWRHVHKEFIVYDVTKTKTSVHVECKEEYEYKEPLYFDYYENNETETKTEIRRYNRWEHEKLYKIVGDVSLPLPSRKKF